MVLQSNLPGQPPPQAPQHPHKITQNSTTRNDPFFWLRDRKNPDTLKYLTAENQYTEAVMKPVAGLQQKLYQEMRSRIQEADSSVPYRIDQYNYYDRTEAGKQYAIYCRKAQTPGSDEGPEEIILDENQLAEGGKYFHLGALGISRDHHLLAYSTDTSGSEKFLLRIKDLISGKLLPDTIKNTAPSIAWANDNRTLYYLQLDEANRPYRLFRHVLGEDPKKDPLIFEEKDQRFELSLQKSRSRKFIFLLSESETTTEARYLDADDPAADFRVLSPRIQGVLYQVDHSGDRFFIVTNDQAENFKIVTAPVSNPGHENWTDFVPYDPKEPVDGLEAFAHYVALLVRRDGLPAIKVFDLESGNSRYVEFQEPTYDVDFGDNPSFDPTQLRLEFSSLITPRSVIDVDLKSGAETVKKRTPVLGGFSTDDYTEERVLAIATDGTKIPISLFYRKGLVKDGSAPIALEGYGAYGLTEDADFNANRLCLADRGFVVALAHIRGGGEYGQTWYHAGRLLNKKNTFTDFIACAEYLLAEKYGSPKKLAISGASAGGLLMGAVMNMRPDLFTTVVAGVPFVDVLNTMSDPSLPLTVTEYEEWGNPNDPTYFDYIRSYSPYDNIVDKPYPNLFVTAGLNDSRVSYWEPAKWLAKQRTLTHQDRLLLLKTNLGAGHMGQSGRFDRLNELTAEYAFILKSFGMADEKPIR
ncbi:MAG: S9 family peptidase [Verrucomicrobia bacterium]|nr:S9 family peptidase [Verrucomicrobiota bacterium]